MARLMNIFLASLIVMGLFPITHPMFSMQAMHVDEATISHQSNMDHEGTGENSTGSCCDEIASFAIGCAFLVPQYAYTDLSGGSKRVINSKPVVQSIYIETATPPPKA
jgi:hypothetical protein